MIQILMQISQRNGNPLPTAGFEKPDRTTKMLISLLALKAAAILGVGKKTGTTRRTCASQGSAVCASAKVHSESRRARREFCARYVLIMHSRSLAAHSFAIDKLLSRENSCCNL